MQFDLPGTDIVSWTQGAGASRKQGTITYGPYSDVAPFRNEAAEFHYVSNSPFAVATSVEKKLDVGRWGSLQVDERYQVVCLPPLPHSPPPPPPLPPGVHDPLQNLRDCTIVRVCHACSNNEAYQDKKMQQSSQQMPCAWR